MTTEPHDLHVLTGAYAVDALDDDERAAFEQHLRACPACQDEVKGLQAVAARMASSESVDPPPALRERVLAEVRETRQLPPLVRDRGRRWAWPRTLSARPLTAAAAAAAVVVAGTLGGVAWQQHQAADQARQTVETVAEVLAAPDLRTAQAAASSGPATATAAVSAQEGAAVFTARDLPSLPSDRAYQLWVLRDGRAVPQPVLRLAADGTTVPVVADDVRDAQALAVTVEPAGGSLTPTSDPLLVVPLA